MGMYDNVIYSDTCKRCGAELERFQSKDGDCLLETLQPHEVTDFYTSCDECAEWHDYRCVNGKVELVSHYPLG